MELKLTHEWYNTISPRFLGLISTVDKEGRPNAAPYGEIMPVSHWPPVVAFSPKWFQDTYANIRETGEFVINVLPESLAEKLMICSRHYPRGVSEFKEAGLTERKSKKVKPPSVEECLAWVECKYLLDVNFPMEISDHLIVVGQVVHMECKDEFVTDGEFDVRRAKPLLHSSSGRHGFCVAERAVEVPEEYLTHPLYEWPGGLERPHE